MLSATFKDTKNIKYLIDSLSELAEDALIFLEGEGVRVEAADPSLICKIEAFFSKNGFSEYEFEEKKRIGIDVESLAKVTRRIRHEDTMQLFFEEGIMRVSLDGVVRRDFHNALIEPKQEELPHLELEFPVILEMDSSVFREIVKDVSVMGNTVLFGVDEKGFSLTAEGDTGKVKIEVPRDNPAIRKLEKKGDCLCKFNLGYLLSFLRASFVSDTVLINFGGKEIPLKIVCPFEENSFLTFYLAPMEF